MWCWPWGSATSPVLSNGVQDTACSCMSQCPQALRQAPEGCHRCSGSPGSPSLCPTAYTSLDTDTGDTTVLPESIVMGERQPGQELSTTQEEPVVVFPVLPPVPWRAVILHRVLAAAAAIAVLLVGILVRLLTGNG